MTDGRTFSLYYLYMISYYKNDIFDDDFYRGPRGNLIRQISCNHNLGPGDTIKSACVHLAWNVGKQSNVQVDGGSMIVKLSMSHYYLKETSFVSTRTFEIYAYTYLI